MKVLALNGSPRLTGNTCQALCIAGEVLNEEGIDFEIFHVGKGPTRDCVACGKCNGDGCVFDDDKVNEFSKLAATCDGFLFGTPVYYAHPSGHVLSFLDRAFYSSSKSFAGKVGASFAIARRAGNVAAFDVMNKYFGITRMIVAGSSYWNIGFGQKEKEFTSDIEGVKTVKNLALNMAYVMKCIDAGKKAGINPPQYEEGNFMNFLH